MKRERERKREIIPFTDFEFLMQNLQDVKDNLDQARSVLKIAEEMQSTYSSNKQRFDDFHEK